MLEDNDLLVMHIENEHEMDDHIQQSSCTVENNTIKSALLNHKNIDDLQDDNQNNSDIKCDFSVCMDNLKSSVTDFSYKQYNIELSQSTIVQEKFEDNSDQKKIIPSELLIIGREYSSKWRKQWEIKCQEWLYRDKFNLEVLNFAKKLYLH